ncbi:hypothetical protein BFGS084_02515 [Bacteroides fragilis]|nr:hypothetical protein HMPREF1203_02167 [Bacteroides fragilis HMW 610]WMI95093.1 hypothetical protein BFGS084_02515 [Bacteroides fragilis]
MLYIILSQKTKEQGGVPSLTPSFAQLKIYTKSVSKNQSF